MSVLLQRSRPDDLVLQLTGLVHVRALLETQGASSAELGAHTEAIARVRAELARFAGTEATDWGEAQ